MTEEFKNKYINLKSRIFERKDSKRIVPNGDIVSIKDVRDAAQVMIPYNKVLLKELNEEVERINKMNGFDKMNVNKAFEKHLFIKSADVALDGNGVCNIFVYYMDENFNRGIVRYTADLYQELGLEYKVNIAMGEKNESKISHIDFPKYFRAAKKFADEFPDVPYVWSEKLDNVYNQKVGDGFVVANINLDAPKRITATLGNVEDLTISREKINNGYLYDDYLGMYNEEFMAKTSVNMNDLNPFLKLITKKHLGLDEDFTLNRQ